MQYLFLIFCFTIMSGHMLNIYATLGYDSTPSVTQSLLWVTLIARLVCGHLSAGGPNKIRLMYTWSKHVAWQPNPVFDCDCRQFELCQEPSADGCSLLLRKCYHHSVSM